MRNLNKITKLADKYYNLNKLAEENPSPITEEKAQQVYKKLGEELAKKSPKFVLTGKYFDKLDIGDSAPVFIYDKGATYGYIFTDEICMIRFCSLLDNKDYRDSEEKRASLLRDLIKSTEYAKYLNLLEIFELSSPVQNKTKSKYYNIYVGIKFKK